MSRIDSSLGSAKVKKLPRSDFPATTLIMTSPLFTTWNNMEIEGSKTLGFGKYYGKTFEYVYVNCHSYCKWVSAQDPHTFSMYDFQQYIIKMNWLS